MANKPSSKKKSTKAVDSSVKGGGILSLNKSRTTPFMKFIIIMIIISMVTLFLYGGFSGFIELFKQQSTQNSATTTDPYELLAQKYDPQITTFKKVLASYPTSATLLVSLANVHESYAFDLATQLQKASSPATSTMTLLSEQWTSALTNYKKAAKIQKPAKDVSVDYAIASYYSGEVTSAITLARGALAQDPNFAPAYYNLGIFYESAGKKALAAEAFQKYLALDPTGQFGSTQYATQQVKSLTASATPSTGTSTTP